MSTFSHLRALSVLNLPSQWQMEDVVGTFQDLDLDVIVQHLLTIKDQNERALNRLQRVEDKVGQLSQRIAKLDARLGATAKGKQTIEEEQVEIPAIFFQTTLEELFVLWYTSHPLWEFNPKEFKHLKYRDILVVMTYLKLSLCKDQGYIISERPNVEEQPIAYAEWLDMIHALGKSAQTLLLQQLSVKMTGRVPGKASTVRRFISSFQKTTEHDAFIQAAYKCYAEGRLVDQHTPISFQKEVKMCVDLEKENEKP